MRQLLQGEHPVTVTARIDSGNGHATVNVQSVDISGMTLKPDAGLYDPELSLPYYPDAKVGQPFELSHNIDRLDVQPARVDVIVKK